MRKIKIFFDSILAFPLTKFSAVDYFLISLLFIICFFCFSHGDIVLTAQNSLNYLFGNPLDFYENCKKIQNGQLTANYFPSVFIIFAIWLYPLKLIGLIKSLVVFPFYFAWWAKILTCIFYLVCGYVFYQIALFYSEDKAWSQYAAFVFLSFPIGVFSVLIFSQCDIFYTLLTAIGFLMFCRRKLFFGTTCFGIAITFKYFPIFVFLPLILLFEKKIIILFQHFLICALPLTFMTVLYRNSPAFIEGVIEWSIPDRIFVAGYNTTWHISFFIMLFFVICSTSYLINFKYTKAKMWIPAYIWLVSSVLPFLFIVWHPQWLLFMVPPIVLTTIITQDSKKNFTIDLCGMFLFIGSTAILFENNVDATMFRLHLLFGTNLELQTLPMSRIFAGFGSHSKVIYISLFSGYLLSQLIIKYTKLSSQYAVPKLKNGIKNTLEIDYNNIRKNFYIGTLLFLLPAFFSVFKAVLKTML